MAHTAPIAAVVTCMDCRLHRPEAQQYEQLCDLLNVEDCYIAAEAGPDGAVLHDDTRFDAVVRNLTIIKKAKHPAVMALVAHYDCAGHPVEDAQHDTDVVSAAQKLSEAVYGEPDRVIPVIAYPSTEDGATWRLKQLHQNQSAVAAE